MSPKRSPILSGLSLCLSLALSEVMPKAKVDDGERQVPDPRSAKLPL